MASKYEKMVGKIINNIKILAVIGKTKKHEAIIQCECHCGNIFECIGYSLISGNTKSCGCLNNVVRTKNIQKYNMDIHEENKYEIKDSYVFMESKTSNDIIVFDKHNLDKIIPHSWTVDNGYAVACINGKRTKMHQLILKAPKGKVIDHIKPFGGIPKSLNNIETNLRAVTQHQNMMNQSISKNNTSGYRGVTFHKKTGKWQPQIRVNGKRIYLGLFDTPKEAYSARLQAETKYFKEFAPQED